MSVQHEAEVSNGAETAVALQNERQPGKRQRQTSADHGAALAKQQRRERDRDIERARDRIKREREAFGGCYAPVLEAMLQPLPKQACPDTHVAAPTEDGVGSHHASPI